MVSSRYIVLALALTACATPGGAPTPRSPTQPVVGQPLPDFAVADMTGDGQLRLSSLKGKVVLLDIWASWCAPCKEEMPLLDEISARLKKSGVEIVAVSIDEEKASAEAFLRSRPRWSLRLAHDPEGKIPGLLKPHKMPTSYIIDRDGIVRQVNSGFQREDAAHIEAKLRELTGS